MKVQSSRTYFSPTIQVSQRDRVKIFFRIFKTFWGKIWRFFPHNDVKISAFPEVNISVQNFQDIMYPLSFGYFKAVAPLKHKFHCIRIFALFEISFLNFRHDRLLDKSQIEVTSKNAESNEAQLWSFSNNKIRCLMTDR